jgi:hypothetical protein
MAKAEKEQKNNLVSVEFIKPWSRYSKGDIAGFDAEQAARLKEAKVAVKPGEKSAEPEKEDPAA